MKPALAILLPLSLLALVSHRLAAQALLLPTTYTRAALAGDEFDSTSSSCPFPAGFSWAETERAARRAPGAADEPDYLFPRAGHGLATLLTGIPYAAIGEYAYGLTDRIALGVTAGLLDNGAPGFGVRLRGIVAQPSPDFRLHFRVPVIYYPRAKNFGCPGCDAWFLIWPAINAEWGLASGTRVWVGGGVVAAACASKVLGFRNAEMEREEGVHEGTWQTLQLGFARPLTRRVSFQLEASLVTKHGRLATQTWVGGPPVILTTGFSYSF